MFAIAFYVSISVYFSIEFHRHIIIEFPSF